MRRERKTGPMMVQVDVDGTLDYAPRFLSWMTCALRAGGHQVLVVSSRVESEECRQATERELKSWGIGYDALLLSPEIIPPENLPDDLHPGHRIYFAKVLAAQAHGVEVLLDDCGITTELFRRYLPHIKVFRPLSQ